MDNLDQASASLQRIHEEVKKWDTQGAEYVQRRFAEIKEWDFPVYAAGNVKIQSKKGRLVPFILNRVQRQLWRWMLQDLAAGKPVRWFVLKARQEGVSTFVLAFFLWLCSLRPNRNALVCAHDEAATTNFNSRLRSMYVSSQPQLKPPTVTDNRDMLHFGTTTLRRKRGAEAGLDSRIIFSTAQRGELGRSYNFHAVLLSEFAIWPILGVNINVQLAALNQAIADEAGTIVILESTAKGENEAAKIWHDQHNGYRKIFISWVAFDDYRKPILRADLGELCATDEGGDKSTRYGNEVEEARLIRDELAIWYPEELGKGGEKWLEDEVAARINWRRYTIDKKCMGDVGVFRHEFPTCPAHAWSTSSKGCFDQRSLEAMRAYVQEEAMEPVRCAYQHDPETNNANRKFKVQPYGKVQFFRTPDEFDPQECQFVIGADTSMGFSASADPSAAIVLRVAPDALDEVASFNGVIPPDEFAEMLFYLGILYNKALIGVEHNERGGAVVNTVLSKFLHYPRLYYPRDPYTGKRSKTPGFITSAVNKSALVSDLAQLIRDHGILFRSMTLIDQLGHYQEHSNGKLGGAVGWKDDMVSAAMIAAFLSTKVHQFAPPPPEITKGSFLYEAQQMARSRGMRVPGM